MASREQLDRHAEIRQAVAAVLAEHPDWGRCKIAREVGCSQSSARRHMLALPGAGAETPVPVADGDWTLRVAPADSAPKAPAGTGALLSAVSVSEFLAPFDVPAMIRDALRKLGKGRVIRDADFRAELHVAADKWARARKRDEFASYQHAIKGTLYWAHPETVAEIRRTVEVL